MGGHRAFGAGDDLVDGPVDLAAVRADDALLDAIAGGAISGGVGAGDVFGRPGQDDDHLAAVLAAWKADIEAEPMPELVSLDEAAEAVEAGHAARDRRASRARRRMPFAVAAAAIAVALSGFTVAIHSAQPGDAMFGLTKVFFSQHADNVVKAEKARSTIVEANNAIARGDKATAASLLQTVQGQIQAVPPEDQPPLVQQRQDALNSLDPTAPTAPTASNGSAPATPEATKPTKPASATTATKTTTVAPAPDGTTTSGTTAEQGRNGVAPPPPATTTTTPVAGK
ncbi:anti-sigma-D factor RsdA [Actinomycetospora chiangmaiensis]|uniref:anti-sigma-D factor RsdA n=1 Tax=Actinomycetospora chiangmaiensis TaxID=402650 RepID=UPI00036AB9B9|nr:anti-sigma-D factor RsdA [Actinomycetospora chiangmaiensis]